MDRDRENPPEPMDEGTKRRCDVLQALRENAWNSIGNRRSTEWRVSFSLWTALAGLVVLALQYKIHLKPEWVGHVAAVVFLLHAWCLWGMLKRYWVDRGMAVVYESKLRHLANVNLPNNLEADLDDLLHHPRQFPCGLGWWVGSQLVVTALLCAVAALVLTGVIRAGSQPALSVTPEALQGGHVAARLPDSTCFRNWETRDGACSLHGPADVVLEGCREWKH